MSRLRFPGGAWKRFLALFAAAFAALVFAQAALAQDKAGPKALKGIALVVGNGDYEHLAKLANPANDAHAIEEMLDGLGFETDVVSDRDARRLRRALEGFVEDAEGADVAVIYYSGHGIEAGGENFLVPVDADIAALDDAGAKLVPLSEIVEELKRTVPVAIVMLDACRSNPFPPGATVKVSSEAQGAPIGGGGLGAARGVVSLSAKSSREENFGTVIGFAAEPGHVALDGEPGGNSPYAAAILRHLSAMEGAEFGTVMRMVAEEVYLKTAGRQRPWVNESLSRLLYFGAPAPQPQGEEGAILGERRQLLLTIAALPEPGRRQIETLAQSGGVPMDALYGMLKALGTDAPKDPAELDRLMRGQTERLKMMLAERDVLKSADPEITRLSALANKALDEGALEASVRLFGEAKDRVATLDKSVGEAEADIARKRAEFAAVYAHSGDAHALAFDFADAAKDYALAYAQIARWDDEMAWRYKHSEALALERQGSLRGDNDALESAVVAAGEALRIAEPFAERTSWMTTQNVLGNALFTLGDRDQEPQRLRAAIDAFHAALSQPATADAGLLAKIHNNLANALTVLGTRSGDDAMLQEAVNLYEAALDQFERDEDPVAWAAAWTNFGKTAIALGELRNSIDILEVAGEAFEAALSVTPQDQSPDIWAAAHNNLGNVHQALGIRTANPVEATGRHIRALFAYRNALLELTRERVPVQWASVQQNMANTLQSLALRSPDAAQANAYLAQALAAHDAALMELTRERTPSMWAAAKLAAGLTLQQLSRWAATPAESVDALKAAAAAQAEALQVLTKDSAPGQWANGQIAYAQTLQVLSQTETDPVARRDHLIRAEMAQRAVLQLYPAANKPSERAAVQHALGLTLMELALLEDGIGRYREAERVFREEQALLSHQDQPARWAASQAGIGNAMRAIGLVTRDRSVLLEARQRTEEARSTIQPFDTSYNGVLDQRLAEIDAALAAK